MNDYAFPIVELQRLLARLHEACIAADRVPAEAEAAHRIAQAMQVELGKLKRSWPVAVEVGADLD